jgi:hypothetical protein
MPEHGSKRPRTRRVRGDGLGFLGCRQFPPSQVLWAVNVIQDSVPDRTVRAAPANRGWRHSPWDASRAETKYGATAVSRRGASTIAVNRAPQHTR